MDRRKLFVFDLDGTMFDTEIISYQCWRDVSARYGFKMGRDVFDLMLGRDNLRVRSTCENAFGPTYPYDRVCKEKVELQLEYYRTHDIPMKPGLLHILEYAKEQGILCAVASSSPRKLIEYLLKKTAIDSFFTVVQSGEEAAHGKPEPDIFLMACDKAGIAPEDALVLEDSESGILAAHAAGIPSVWIPDLVTIPEEVQQLAWQCCQRLDEVPARLEPNYGKTHMNG